MWSGSHSTYLQVKLMEKIKISKPILIAFIFVCTSISVSLCLCHLFILTLSLGSQYYGDILKNLL
jgi:hypothetical protein